MFHRILLLPVLLSLVFSELFFSEYAEGSSNNKYLEIFNSGDSTVDLSGYAYPSAANAVDVVGQHEYWNDFPVGASIAAGDVYVICHGSADALILAECDHNHTYLSNGDDGYCIVSGTEDSYTILDCVGDWNGDPGTGWDVAGVSNGTVDHTLARKIGVTQGNAGNWSLSAGTNSDDSEWVVLDNEVWTFLGSHPHEDFSGGTATGGGTTGGDDGGATEDCSNGIDDDGDSFIDCDDFDCNCGSEICDNGIDDDGDSFIDCDDFNCSSDSACDGETTGGGSGSCAEYGCVGYTPSNACQCNDLCEQYNNCCDDYQQECGGTSTGGGGGEICDDGVDNDGDSFIDCDDFDCNCGSEICDNGIDDDGDSYIDCDDFNCSSDAACNSGTTGGGDGGGPSVADNLFFSEYAEGSGYNKYLEVYNADNVDVDLSYYSLSTCSNGCNTIGQFDYPDNFIFDSGSILAPGEIFIICHPGTSSNSTSNEILNECDGNFTYFSNGDDAMALTLMSTGEVLDIVGDTGDDPGTGWSVAGVTDGTLNHTLVRKPTVTSGNGGDWSSSAGASAETSEWIVYASNTWDNIGVHFIDDGSPILGCTDENAYNYNSYATIDDGTCLYSTQATINQIQGQVNDSPYADTPIITTGVITGVSYNGFYMQDGDGMWNGIWVYAENVQGFDSLLSGDLVEVQGLVKEYNNLTEIEATSVAVQSSGNTLPAPSEINTGDLTEPYEGVLVKFSNASCLSLPDQYGEWQVNDGSGLASIDDKLLEDYAPDLNQAYDIVGVADFSYGSYKVQAKEITAVYQEGYPVSNAGNDQDVDEGDSVTLDGSSSYTDDGIILSYLWNQTGGVNVDLGDYESAVVSFTAPSEVTLLTFTLEVTNSLGNTDIDNVSVQVGEPVEICDDGVDNDGDPYVDCDDFDCNDDPACGGSGTDEICDDGVDNDGDSYIDCDDFDCTSDVACGGSGTDGSCAEYGCIGFTPSNSCQCNDLCEQYNNCCDDYQAVCGSGTTGGDTGLCSDYGCGTYDSSNSCQCDDQCSTFGNCCSDYDDVCGGTSTGGGDDEICDDGVDNDGDSYIDCDDYDCDDDSACGGSSTGGGDICDTSSLDNLFFSEYAEGTSNNKYLEIYNAGSDTIDLCGYAYPNATNGADIEGSYDYWNVFDSGAEVAAGDVYVICHGSFAGDALQCDETHTYLSNGNDGFCLVYGDETNYSKLDCIGDWSSTNPGNGWEVAGVSDATKDHTLVRKSSVTSGNQGDWTLSAGTDADDSEWIVLDVDTWDNLGSHQYDGSSTNCTPGDGNDDGIVNVQDIVLAVGIALGQSSYSECSDVNSDGTINVQDIVGIVSIVLGN
tara:strand:+ start:383 stop:4399 length:4017 start_codon:yes stop_codon:yes gene_type:complete